MQHSLPDFLYLHLMIRHISIIVLFALSSGLMAQKPTTTNPVSNSQRAASFSSGQYSHKPDTVKKPRILKEWKLSPDYSEEIPLQIDTVFSLFHRNKIADKYSPVNATLGNYGLPFYQLSFFDRVTDPDEYLYKYYYPLMHLADNAVFMNTQAPYSELDWSFGGPRETAEQTFRVMHSQNVNRFLNFGLIYDIVFSLGQYNYQRAEDKTFTFFSSYTGGRYNLYFSAGVNSITSYFNGGITDINGLNQSNTRDVPVNLGGLNTAEGVLKNKNLLIVQRYTLGGTPSTKKDTASHKKQGFLGLSGTFSHIFLFETNKRNYSDNYPESGFYDTTYISQKVTNDSLYSRSIKNTVRFDFTTDETRKFRLGGGVGIRNEIFRYSQIIPTHDTLHADTASWNRSNNSLVGRLYNNIGTKFRWLATGELYLTGYRAGDFNLNGEISKYFDWKKGRAAWLITGAIANRQPSFWYQQWGGNNFEWNNNLNKEFRIDLGTDFSYPGRKTEIKINYAIIKNYTDFDTTAYPSQYTGGLSVASLKISKDLRAWKFHLATDLIVQKSSNSSILDLPLVTVRSAGYFEHLFRFPKTGGKLNTQIGVDVTYNTAYHAYAFMPATGIFYRQDKDTEGDYPYINAFLNIKLKRTRIFIMLDHLNWGLMNQSKVNDYFMVSTYPMNIRMLRYGIAWTFYN
jgi:hypothetical protein